MRKIKISISPSTSFFIILLALVNDFSYLLITAASALLHELGHILAAALCKVRINKITLFPFGADIKIASDKLIPYKTDIFIKSAGITANICAVIGCIIYLSLASYSSSSVTIIGVQNIKNFIVSTTNENFQTTHKYSPTEAIEFFLVCNLGMAMVNSVPIETLDGGGVLAAILSLKTNPERVTTIMDIVSFIFILLLWIAACYFIMFFGTNFNLFIICGYLFIKLFLT